MSSFSIDSALIIGAGTMGSGIAQWMAQQGSRVELVDINFDFANESLKKVYASWDKLEKKGKFTPKEINSFKENISVVKMDEISRDPHLVIEAIIENLEIKQKLFLELDQKLSKKTIFSSNTSSIPIEKIASVLPSDRQSSFLGLHFFNPATIMKLVEVIKSKWTDEKIAADLANWFDSKGKRSALCLDRPGFIVNRVARNFYGEALRIAENDNQEKLKEVDDVLTKVGGFKMGPFTLMDLIGIDVNLDVTKSVWEAFDREPRFAPHKLQERMVEEKRFGKKTKKGFYHYE